MIYDMLILVFLSHTELQDKLNDVVDNYQRDGLLVDVQYGAGPNNRYSALVIARKPDDAVA